MKFAHRKSDADTNTLVNIPHQMVPQAMCIFLYSTDTLREKVYLTDPVPINEVEGIVGEA